MTPGENRDIKEENRKRRIAMDYAKESLKKHAQWGGKIEVISKVPPEKNTGAAAP